MDIENKLVITNWRVCSIGVEEWEVQTIEYTIGSRTQCTT